MSKKSRHEAVGDAGDIAKQIAEAAGETYVNKVRIETTISDDTVKPFEKGKKDGAGGGGFGEVMAKVLRPKFTIYDKLGKVEAEVAPYGEPKEVSGLVKVVGVVGGLLGLGAVFGAGRLSKGKR